MTERLPALRSRWVASNAAPSMVGVEPLKLALCDSHAGKKADSVGERWRLPSLPVNGLTCRKYPRGELCCSCHSRSGSCAVITGV